MLSSFKNYRLQEVYELNLDQVVSAENFYLLLKTKANDKNKKFRELPDYLKKEIKRNFKINKKLIAIAIHRKVSK